MWTAAARIDSISRSTLNSFDNAPCCVSGDCSMMFGQEVLFLGQEVLFHITMNPRCEAGNRESESTSTFGFSSEACVKADISLES